jgi:UDP-N-acetyl-D-galactosamine dehydrogenase
MNIYQSLIEGEKALAVVGLGYVGMPLAIEFAKKIRVIGYDRNQIKINSYLNGIDVTGEVGDEALKNTKAVFTYDGKYL